MAGLNTHSGVRRTSLDGYYVHRYNGSNDPYAPLNYNPLYWKGGIYLSWGKYNKELLIIQPKIKKICTRGGNRTRTTYGQGILSPSCLPIPPPELLGLNIRINPLNSKSKGKKHE